MGWHHFDRLLDVGRRWFRAMSLATVEADRANPPRDLNVTALILPECPPEFRFEYSTQGAEQDLAAISPRYRLPTPLKDRAGIEPGPTPEERTMPRRILRMIRELHARGYERLRAVSGFSPSGCHWRCGVLPVSRVLRSHGARGSSGPFDDGFYTTGLGARCFGWTDAAGDSPEQLAEKFLERFAELSESGRGPDPAYARWYSEMLWATEPDGLFVAEADQDDSEDMLTVIGRSLERSIPLPPPGEG